MRYSLSIILPANLDSPRTWGQSAILVVKKNESLTHPVADRDACAYLQSMREREQKRVESEEQNCSFSMDKGPQTLAATRPWIERTR